MRRRLLIALTGFAALAVLAFAVPLCLTTATSRTQELVSGRGGDAERFASLTRTAQELGDHRALSMEVAGFHDLYGEAVLIVDARGATVINAGVDASDPRVVAALAAARRNQRPATVTRLRPWSPDPLLIARPVGSDMQVEGAVLIIASTSTARADITRVWLIVAAGALAALAVCGVLAWWLSRWVLRPLAGLSVAVAELTASLPRPRVRATVTRRHGGPPELRAVAQSFDSMAAAVRDSAHAQRRLIDDTAHALRNPLAALTIRLDSLQPAISDAAAATFRGATREVERLTGLLDGLLSLAVAEGTDLDPVTTSATQHCDAMAVVEDRIDAWRTAFAEAGIALTATPTPTSAVHASAGPTTAEPLTGMATGAEPTATTFTHPAPAPAAQVGAVAGATPTDAPATPQTSPAAVRDCVESTSGPGVAVAAVSADILAQILDVPLSNACRYAGAGTTTRLTVAATPGWVGITVADNGTGVPAAELDQLSTRFFRGSSSSGHTGSGLGLPIAAALASSRHGSLSVRAVDPHGLAVVVRLPAAPAENGRIA
ncbi:ATP-binding protein [Nocardia sp. NPDC059240]|uniref:sensor histidine kinase n=1 Tax=Nocardia sp. NPDC059240 TaxID=3346786 RepID=UPI0036757B15